ncbi:MAG: hypothetical protein Q8R48_07185, partial [Candidatus Omnitrophota bacterium]|nr:hypothetical protein [Candidatus Omnitrophota bacterium]
AVYFSGTSTQDFSYNDLCPIYGTSATTGIIMGPGNINDDPLFADLSHLQPSSPCVNAGDPAAQYNDKDGTRNDMGAYGGGE